MTLMLHKLLTKSAIPTLALGAALMLVGPTAAFAQRGGRERHSSGGGGRSFSGGARSYSAPSSGRAYSGGAQNSSRSYNPRGFSGSSPYSGGQSFVSPRGYSGGTGYYGRGYIAPRSYGRPVYRGYYNGGIYLGYGAPYGYTYDPVYDSGYAYDPAYSYGPAPAPQSCADGSYDRNGTWIPNPNCYSGQQQYQTPPPNYNPNQRQYPQQQQNYDPNQQPYPQPQQNYDPNQPQRYNR